MVKLWRNWYLWHCFTHFTNLVSSDRQSFTLANYLTTRSASETKWLKTTSTLDLSTSRRQTFHELGSTSCGAPVWNGCTCMLNQLMNINQPLPKSGTTSLLSLKPINPQFKQLLKTHLFLVYKLLIFPKM